MQDIALIEAQQPEIVGGYARLDGDMIVFTGSTWEDHAQAWQDAESEVVDARWKQAAIINSFEVTFGESNFEKFARDVGVHHARLYEFRAAFRLREAARDEFVGRPTNLTFSHYVIAASAPNAVELIKAAADECMTARQIKRLVKQSKAPDIDDDITNAIEDAQSREIWQDIKRRLGTLGGRCPNLRGIIGAFIEEMEYELTRPTETIRQAIDSAIIEGYDEIDQIAQRINRNRIYVAAWMNRLEEEGDYIRFEKARAPGARGAARTGYRPKG